MDKKMIIHKNATENCFELFYQNGIILKIKDWGLELGTNVTH